MSVKGSAKESSQRGHSKLHLQQSSAATISKSDAPQLVCQCPEVYMLPFVDGISPKGRWYSTLCCFSFCASSGNSSTILPLVKSCKCPPSDAGWKQVKRLHVLLLLLLLVDICLSRIRCGSPAVVSAMLLVACLPKRITLFRACVVKQCKP